MEHDRHRVSLIVGGAQKAGTTSLHGYLSQHPRLRGAVRKEVHFFDREKGVDWAEPDYAIYHASFPQPDPGQILFESTPVYLFWPPAIARIRAYNPEMRLIFLLRDPIERAWSHWCMEYARHAEDLPFAAAIRQGRWRLKGIGPLDQAWRVYSYVERGFYARQIRRVLDQFPRDRLLFLRSEDLRDAREETLQRIAAFLGIEPFPPLSARSDRTRPGIAYPSRLTDEDRAYLASLYRHDLRELEALGAVDTGGWVTAQANS